MVEQDREVLFLSIAEHCRPRGIVLHKGLVLEHLLVEVLAVPHAWKCFT